MKRRCKQLLSILLIAAHCLVAPVRPASAFTISEEREVGEKLLYTIRSHYQLVDDPDISQYINNLGREVLKVAGIQYFDYRFFIVNNSEFNAFAAPSGLIFFYSGLISTMNSENELLSVMAHEIGHVSKRHLASRMEKGKIVGIASIGMALAALALGSGAAAPTLMMGSLAAGQSATLHFSRQDEEEADLLAYGWMDKMGRNPEGQERMLQTMRRIARYRSEKMPQYLLTHPDSEARLDYVQSLLENEDKEKKDYTPVNEFEFLRCKYRIMSQVHDKTSFRTYLAGVMSNPRSTGFAVNMAKYGLSQLDRLENNFDSSLKLIDEVIAAFPQYPVLQADKAVIELAVGKAAEARRTLEGVLRQDSANMYAAFQLAKILNQQGDAVQAEKYLKEVAYEIPEYSKVYFELGQIAANQGKNGVAAAYLGKYYLYEGKIEMAKENLKKAIANTSTPADTRKECKDLLVNIKRLEDA
jgi:beta-barrel assembly-enhancing protease